MKTLLTLLGIALVSISGWLGYQVSNNQSETPNTLGAFRPSGYSGKLLTRLNSGGSESSFNTTPCTTPDGQTITANAIGDFIVITVNPGAANEEKVSASTVSCSGTTLTWTIENRGLSFASATSTITANKKQHAIGETVIISNDDQFLATQYVDIDSSQTIAALKTFTLGALFGTAASSTDECTALNEYCTKTYIDNLVNQGAATSTESIGGIAELATQIEMASSTDYGSTRPLVLQAKYATSTPGYAGLWAVITNNAGKIAQGFLDWTQSIAFSGNNTHSGTNIFTASSTFTGSNLHLGLSSGGLNIDSNGLVYSSATTTGNPNVVISTAQSVNFSGTATTTMTLTIPAGAMTATSIANVKLILTGTGANGSSDVKISIGTGSASTTIFDVVSASGLPAFTPYTFNLTIGNDNSLSSQYYLGVGTSTSASVGFPMLISGTTAINTTNQWYISWAESSTNASHEVVVRQRSVKIEK